MFDAVAGRVGIPWVIPKNEKNKGLAEHVPMAGYIVIFKSAFFVRVLFSIGRTNVSCGHFFFFSLVGRSGSDAALPCRPHSVVF